MGPGKSSNRNSQPSKSRKATKPRSVPEDLPSDDEVDKFHKTKDKLSLNPAEEEASSDEDEDELDDEAVYNLSVSEDSEDDDVDDSEGDEEDEDNKSHYAQRVSWHCFPCKFFQRLASFILLQYTLTWWLRAHAQSHVDCFLQ